MFVITNQDKYILTPLKKNKLYYLAPLTFLNSILSSKYWDKYSFLKDIIFVWIIYQIVCQGKNKTKTFEAFVIYLQDRHFANTFVNWKNHLHLLVADFLPKKPIHEQRADAFLFGDFKLDPMNQCVCCDVFKRMFSLINVQVLRCFKAYQNVSINASIFLHDYIKHLFWLHVYEYAIYLFSSWWCKYLFWAVT